MCIVKKGDSNPGARANNALYAYNKSSLMYPCFPGACFGGSILKLQSQ